MSRVGKKPIQIPEKMTVSLNQGVLRVEGEKGKLEKSIHSDIDLKIEGNLIKIGMFEENRRTMALQGLFRSLVANMVHGVSKGFERVLEIHGIGYRADLNGNNITFNLGYSHLIEYELPEGITTTISKNNVITLFGIDKELLGKTAAYIRSLRPPEPYKGKGIKYAEEYIQKKAGKTGTK